MIKRNATKFTPTQSDTHYWHGIAAAYRTALKNFLIVLTSFFSSCVGYHLTSEGGERVNNPKVFKYNKPRYLKLNKGLIDTAAIYFKDSSYNKWDFPKWQTSYKKFARFFTTGQVLFVDCNTFPGADSINNPNLGTPGYFIVRGTKLKIDMFQGINGGQTGKYYGRIQPNGDIIFYDQRPETYFNSFSHLEKAEGNHQFSRWRKIKVDSLKSYKPGW